MEDILNIRLNPIQIYSIQSFTNIKGRYNNKIKDVYFIRIIGFDDKNKYLSDIKNMDIILTQRKNNHNNGYLRINHLPDFIEYNDAEFYYCQYENWINKSNKKLELKFDKFDVVLYSIYCSALQNIEQMFKNQNTNAGDSIVKNFIIKILFWSDYIFPSLFEQWDKENSYKFVFCGNLKKHGYYFLYFLTQIGVDVMYLNPEKDLDFDNNILNFSLLDKHSNFLKIDIPVYNSTKVIYQDNKINLNNIEKSNNIIDTVRIKIPEKTRAKKQEKENNINNQRKELEFEELAKLASSVVMISVHDRYDKCFKTGSGVMVNKDGYILTNHHVASEGYYYSVRIEEDENIYPTDEIIKYNPLFDLSLIRINRQLKPISVYNKKEKLVRGQKVVAIGSPLGLFNSVSNGIISGFRQMDDINMIQFTAPISSGSSGGAVLNMYGELIGISTAGIDSGQNINLAVDYKTIFNFIRVFL